MNQPTIHPPRRPSAARRSNQPAPAWRTVASLLVLAIAAIFLFARLGHYSLWDDEAMTALTGEGVWRTGDTTAVMGHNIMAYHDGMLLTKDLKSRYESPLEYYVAAPFAGLWPGSALAVRIPFAVLGLLTVGLVLWWMRRDKVSSIRWVLVAMGIVANVSFWLYCRQCRYYSLTIFLSAALAFLYLHYEDRWWVPVLIGLVSAALFASNYLIYVAVYGAMGIDWLIWGRKTFRPGWRGWLWIGVPQILLNVPIFCIWCPLAGSYYADLEGRVVVNRFLLFWWCLRDMDTCEFGVWLLVLIAPVLWLWRRDHWLLRGPVAAILYVAIVALLSPQRMWQVTPTGEWRRLVIFADVRFLCPLILLLIVTAALVIKHIVPARASWLAIPIGAAVFFTSILHLARMVEPGTHYSHWSAGSVSVDYLQELLDPPTDPYTVVSNWINEDVKEGQSIRVMPDHMCYPLMFHAPKAVYAWQLSANKRDDFPALPAIDFSDLGVPDYVIVFGRAADPAETLHLPNHHVYLLVRLFDVYGQDLFRPELFLRTFHPFLNFDPMTDGVRIYKCIGPDTERPK